MAHTPGERVLGVGRRQTDQYTSKSGWANLTILLKWGAAVLRPYTGTLASDRGFLALPPESRPNKPSRGRYRVPGKALFTYS